MNLLIVLLLTLGFILICMAHSSPLYPVVGCALFIIAMVIEDWEYTRIRNNADEDRPE